MLCNVIVRATHDLHVHQSKSADQIITYLNTDCQNLGHEELIEQVSWFVFFVDKTRCEDTFKDKTVIGLRLVLRVRLINLL
jgi:hypothetical protein